MARGAARQAQVDAHVRVVEQPGFRALGLGHQGEPLAVHDCQPHQFAGGQGKAVNDRLRDIDHARAAQKAQPHRGQLGRQRIFPPHRRLPHIAVFDQFVQGAVAAAAQLIQVVGHGGQGHAVGVIRQVFKQRQCLFDCPAHRLLPEVGRAEIQNLNSANF
ncbi:hypothetical protein D3C73_1013310 [compost metagenome]